MFFIYIFILLYFISRAVSRQSYFIIKLLSTNLIININIHKNSLLILYILFKTYVLNCIKLIRWYNIFGWNIYPKDKCWRAR
nr:MAG TPA: hypothetical protein [Caudoviricetes sp.]